MAWNLFPYPEAAYVYTSSGLKKAWARLHVGDIESWPKEAALVQAWIAFHAGNFEQAAKRGPDCGLNGYSVANKASCVYADYLASADKFALFEEVALRCERQQSEQPDNPAGYYWHAYALGRYAQGISVFKALAQGVGVKVRDSLDKSIRLAPKHADAHIALGTFHAEIIDKVGALLGSVSYGVKKEDGYQQFKIALALNPDSAIARIEYANALLMLDGNKMKDDAGDLYRAAAQCSPKDAMERLHVEAAKVKMKQAS